MQYTKDQQQKHDAILAENNRRYGNSSLGNMFETFANLCDLDEAGLVDEDEKRVAGAAFAGAIVSDMDGEDARRVQADSQNVLNEARTSDRNGSSLYQRALKKIGL